MLIFLALIATGSSAADQVLTITVPDAYVSRVVSAFEAQYKCSAKGLTPKQCVEKMVRDKIKAIVKAYEKKEARKTAEGSITDIEVN